METATVCKKVLVIDDDKMFHRLIGVILQREGIEVEFAMNGEAGVERVGDTTPDLVVLDYMMPDMDGLEVSRRIRALSTVPILFLSALDHDQVRRQALEYGNGFLLKPFHLNDLRTQLGTLLGAQVEHA